MTALYTHEQIPQLIPQRPPIVMIDTIWNVDEQGIMTALTIKEDNIFLYDRHLTESGLIENMAQTAAAFAGVRNISEQVAPQIGFIGEVKDFICHEFPQIGDTLYTSLTTIADIAGVRLVACKTKKGEQLIAEGQLKIVIQN